jgi:hypothetical protein
VRLVVFWFFVDLAAGEPGDRAPTLFSPCPAASPKPSEALPRFGLDIGVERRVGQMVLTQ